MSRATRPSSTSHGVVPARTIDPATTTDEPVSRHASSPTRSTAPSTAAVATPRATSSSAPVTRKTAASRYGYTGGFQSANEEKNNGARAPSWSSSDCESVCPLTANAASSRTKPGGLSRASPRWKAATAATTAASPAIAPR